MAIHSVPAAGPAGRPASELGDLARTAATILDSVVEQFVDGVGAPRAVSKGGHDFATQVDLDLERRISEELVRSTGVAVHGEEFGGPAVDEGTVWVLDPIDGTFNYSVGMPYTGILLGLLVDGQPVLGLSWLPLAGMRLVGRIGSPLVIDGVAKAPLERGTLAASAIAFGPFDAAHGGRYPGARRADILRELSARAGRLRMTGSTGVDMAYTAAGVVGGAITFGRHAWDNAAGAALVRSAGGIATDLEGRPWTASSTALVAAAPGIHDELIALIDDVIGGDWTVPTQGGTT